MSAEIIKMLTPDEICWIDAEKKINAAVAMVAAMECQDL